jgi:diacylglycerol kinase family enzyme
MEAARELPLHTEARAPAAQRLRKVELLVNTLSGHVGPGAREVAEQILREFGLDPTVRSPAPEDITRELRAAVDTGPDALILLAGDGTARAAANLCGPDGPLLAPLAGGTMNMLPHALYGPKPWQAALRETLETGIERPVSGGVVDGQRFYVAAILGPPALWAEAREAARVGRLSLAVRKAKVAWIRSLGGQLSFSVDGGRRGRAEALSLICPLVSRAMNADEPMLEAAAIRPRGPAEAVRLGLRALLSEIIGDWRSDPAVKVARVRSGEVASEHGHVRAILDGEPVRLGRRVRFAFTPTAFRALAPPLEAPQPQAASSILHE